MNSDLKMSDLDDGDQIFEFQPILPLFLVKKSSLRI